MSGEQSVVQKVVFEALKADDVLTTMINGVYDRIPKNPFGVSLAYVSFGPSSYEEDDAECIGSGTVNLQVDVWSRQADLDRSCRDISDRVRRILYRSQHEVAAFALGEMTVGTVRVFRDADGLTSHGVVPVTVSVEDIE